MSENRLYLNVSDADLFEHLADYELLRRRCKLIVAIDGMAGVHRTVHRLLTLIRLGELVLRIRNDPDLDKLRIGDAGNSRAHFKPCPIDYGRGQQGFPSCIQSSMSGNESEFLHNWRRKHPAHPYQTTADQLCEESQFEAYRPLGERVARYLFRRKFMSSINPTSADLRDDPGARKTGEVVLGKTATRHTSAESVALLTDIVANQPVGKPTHVIADNLSAHKTKRARNSWPHTRTFICTSLQRTYPG